MNREKNLNYEDTRVFLNQLLTRAYSNPDCTANDAKALASLAGAMNTLLLTAEDKENGTLKMDVFLRELNRITEDAVLEKSRKTEDASQYVVDVSDNDAKFVTDDGKIIYPGSILGSGGEGIVYRVPSMPGKVMKIYRKTVKEKLYEKEGHIKALLSNRVPSHINHVLVCTLPENLLYYRNGEFAGYLMSQTTSNFKIYNAYRESNERARYFPALDYRGLIVIAYNLAELIEHLHQHDVIIGDLNANNIVLNQDGTVCIIDTDSFDVRNRITGKHFSCMVGIPEMLAPELQQAGSLAEKHFSRASDNFSLAILIFRLLMRNADPFGGILEEKNSLENNSVNQAILNGECVYVRKVPGKKIPEWSLTLDVLPEYIRELFDRTFHYTRDSYREKITDRPSAKEWMAALMRFYQSDLVQCSKNPFHWYSSEQKLCPFCGKEQIEQRGKTETKGTIEKKWFSVGI